MDTKVNAFIKKWHGRILEDDGCYVSKEYNSFQNAFKRIMATIAESLDAELVGYSKGHYDMSGFIKRGDKYVYFSYSSALSGPRSQVLLKHRCMFDSGCASPMLFRTAADDRDFRGGMNNFHAFEGCEELIENLLNQEHKRF